MSKRAEELAKQLYPDPELENYDDILVYRADRNNALMGRLNVICVYEQAEKDLALTWEDLQAINDLFFQVDAENSAARDDDLIEQDLPFPYGQPFYEEVLRRFKSFKENKK